jgi:hypothetical protein
MPTDVVWFAESIEDNLNKFIIKPLGFGVFIRVWVDQHRVLWFGLHPVHSILQPSLACHEEGAS